MTHSTIRRFARFAFRGITIDTRIEFIPDGFWSWPVSIPKHNSFDDGGRYLYTHDTKIGLALWRCLYHDFIWGFCDKNNTLYMWNPNQG